jgi:hypothetical protein
VFFEGCDRLLVSVFEDVETFGINAVHSVVVVGDDDVNQNKIRVGTEDGGRGGGCLGWLGRIGRNLCWRGKAGESD